MKQQWRNVYSEETEKGQGFAISAMDEMTSNSLDAIEEYCQRQRARLIRASAASVRGGSETYGDADSPAANVEQVGNTKEA